MGRKSARVRPAQESLLQKRRFWGILVIVRSHENSGFDRYAARLPGGLFICGLLTPSFGCAEAIRPRNMKSCRDSVKSSSRNMSDYRPLDMPWYVGGGREPESGDWDEVPGQENGTELAPALALAAASVAAALASRSRTTLGAEAESVAEDAQFFSVVTSSCDMHTRKRR